MGNKANLIQVFEDTLDKIEKDQTLRKDLSFSLEHTYFFDSLDYPSIKREKDKEGVILVTKHKSFEAASIWKESFEEEKVGVLNFASSTHPGGGVSWGSTAQEECLCRVSTLYPVINQKKALNSYYIPNRAHYTTLANDRILYSEAITVFKDDEPIANPLPKEKWFKVDVLTCAAPNLRSNPHMVSEEKLYELHLSRAKHILHIAAFKGVDYLVLGAFGCGAFQNNPWVVAKAYRDALKEYRGYFKAIEFAIYCRDFETENYAAFSKTLA